MSTPNRNRGGLVIILPSMTLARTQISGLTYWTPGTRAISAAPAAGSREKIGIGAPGCIATSPVTRLNVSLTIWSRPLATENRPIMPMMATVSPTSDSTLRIGRVIRLRSANVNMEVTQRAKSLVPGMPRGIRGPDF